MVASTADPIPPWPPTQLVPTTGETSFRYQKQYVEPDPYGRGMVPLSEAEGNASTSRMYDPKPMHMQRYIPLMGSQEPSHLNATDTLACRSMELFEVMSPDVFGESSSTDRPAVLQVGLRCAFCAESETTAESYIFPANTRSIGDSIRHAGFDHLVRCSHYPDEYQRQIQEVTWKRKERSAGPPSHEDETNRRALIDFCAARCEQFGIVDQHPVGLIFANTGMQLVPMPLSYPAVMGYPSPLPQHRMDDPGMQPYGEGAYGGRLPRSQFGLPHPSQYHDPSATTRKDTREDEAPVDANPLRQQHQVGQRFPHPLQQMHPPIQPPPIVQDFPFFFEQNRWVCKYCAHIPPSYRDPQYFWAESMHTPPPPQFMDYHLGMCREFQRSMMYEQSMAATYGRDPRLSHPPILQSPVFGPQSHGWEQQRPIGRTPPRKRPGTEYEDSLEAVDSPYATPQIPRRQGETSSQHHDAMAASRIRTPISSERPLRSGDDVDVTRAIEYLESIDESFHEGESSLLHEGDRLVVDEDRLLLTDYFYYLMKQLRPVRFSESDRRTRGGKREKVKIGYGGLQCVHCVDVPNSRKFFWSNVDRLANSFAEIPTHVLKCRRCPQPTKDALLVLKNRHAYQMSRLSRGSQKVFFRRMWRRLHQDDPNISNEGGNVDNECLSPIPLSVHGYSSATLEAMRPAPLDTQPISTQQSSQKEDSEYSPSGTSGSDESIYFLQKPAKEAAKALVDASMQSGPPTPSSRVLLAIPEDREWLSDTDCFVRRQLEVFCATVEDVKVAADDRKYPVKEGQVGIRCIHCALTKNGVGARGQAVAYPFSISGIYESAREIERMHLGSSRENLGSRDNLITCENLPLSAKEKLESLKGATSSLSSVLRKYFVLAAKALGLRDSTNGIRAGAEPIPIGSQAPLVLAESPAPENDPRHESERSCTAGTTKGRKSPPSQPSLKRKADQLPSMDRASSKRRTVKVIEDDSVVPTSNDPAVGRGISILADVLDRESTSGKSIQDEREQP
jgi:hypothetical protein